LTNVQSKRTTRAEPEDHLWSADHSLGNADINETIQKTQYKQYKTQSIQVHILQKLTHITKPTHTHICIHYKNPHIHTPTHYTTSYNQSTSYNKVKTATVWYRQGSNGGLL
jgi:hypothetical protein